MYKIEISSQAERDMNRLPTALFDRITPEIQALSQTPRPPGCVKLSGSKSDYRIRVGDYRVLYEIADRIRIVRVIRVRHRREIYR
ncbi:MAG TPA: type II toxin-antitoxin system RelE/ParE family toxin [Phycisphaerae bacterium]|jgi:mRNA interferase RelE/StbE